MTLQNLERKDMLDKILSREDGRGYIWSINILLLYFYMEYVNNTDILCLLLYSVIATDIYPRTFYPKWRRKIAFNINPSPQGVFPLSTKLRLGCWDIKANCWNLMAWKIAGRKLNWEYNSGGGNLLSLCFKFTLWIALTTWVSLFKYKW